MRVFAGPNGSGKSTLNTVLPPYLIGRYLNPDSIELALRAGTLDLSNYGIEITADSLLEHFRSSSFLQSLGVQVGTKDLRIDHGLLQSDLEPRSYIASIFADYLRNRWLENRIPFTFETVMSSMDKVDFMQLARAAGYRVYLYYICTEDPAINASRVKERVRLGGHSVPEEKIYSRYRRSLENLGPAIKNSDRAYLFDNSGIGTDKTFLAQIDDGTNFTSHHGISVNWIETYVIAKLSGEAAP